MNIILGKERADELRERFTVLELDTFDHADGLQIPAFCVVPADKIPLTEMPSLEQYRVLHANMIAEYRKGNRKFCEDAIEHLYGKFGGELDSFYDHVLEKLPITQ